MKNWTTYLAALLLAACGLLTGCLSDDDADEPDYAAIIDDYLAANGLADDAVRLPSGVAYAITEPCAGPMPTLSDSIAVRYRGYLTTGQQFDESTTPVAFPLGGLISAWQQVLPLVAEGSSLRLVSPPSSAYGTRPPQGSGIGPTSILVFDIDLVEVL